MVREGLDQELPARLSAIDAFNGERHFKERERLEYLHFGSRKADEVFAGLPLRNTTPNDLNSDDTCAFVRDFDPQVVIVFGTDLIRSPLMEVLPTDTINVHLGISPRYRGSATLFWPFYFLEPQYAGVTFHRVIHEPDAGAVLHQFQTELRSGDGIHDVGVRSVLQAADELVEILLRRDEGWTFHVQRSTGKNFLSRDFRYEHLRVNYTLFGDRMVDAYLAGELGEGGPSLVKAF
jgi:methionyl-tRNA formyltransferase